MQASGFQNLLDSGVYARVLSTYFVAAILRTRYCRAYGSKPKTVIEGGAVPGSRTRETQELGEGGLWRQQGLHPTPSYGTSGKPLHPLSKLVERGPELPLRAWTCD